MLVSYCCFCWLLSVLLRNLYCGGLWSLSWCWFCSIYSCRLSVLLPKILVVAAFGTATNRGVIVVFVFDIRVRLHFCCVFLGQWWPNRRYRLREKKNVYTQRRLSYSNVCLLSELHFCVVDGADGRRVYISVPGNSNLTACVYLKVLNFVARAVTLISKLKWYDVTFWIHHKTSTGIQHPTSIKTNIHIISCCVSSSLSLFFSLFCHKQRSITLEKTGVSVLRKERIYRKSLPLSFIVNNTLWNSLNLHFSWPPPIMIMLRMNNWHWEFMNSWLNVAWRMMKIRTMESSTLTEFDIQAANLDTPKVMSEFLHL